MSGRIWEEIQENMNWDRDGWKFVCNILPILGNRLKEEHEYTVKTPLGKASKNTLKLFYLF